MNETDENINENCNIVSLTTVIKAICGINVESDSFDKKWAWEISLGDQPGSELRGIVMMNTVIDLPAPSQCQLSRRYSLTTD